MTNQFYEREISLITGCTIEQAREVLAHLEKINVNADLGKVRCSEFSMMVRNSINAMSKI